MEASAALRAHACSTERKRRVRRARSTWNARYHGLIRASSWRDAAVIPQILEHFPAALVARFRLFGQRLHHRRADRPMNRRVNLPRRNRLFVHNLVDDRGYVLSGKRLLACDHLIEQNAQRKDIAPSVNRATLHLFW